MIFVWRSPAGVFSRWARFLVAVAETVAEPNRELTAQAMAANSVEKKRSTTCSRWYLFIGTIAPLLYTSPLFVICCPFLCNVWVFFTL
jgi:hypothetical protein